MPTLLPPRRVRPSRDDSGFSPLLSVIAALLALLLVLVEAQAMGAMDWKPFVPPDGGFAVPF